jgi:hypothetical protein
MTDNMLRIFPDAVESNYPLLVAHYDRIKDIPSVKSYLASPRRPEYVSIV